MDHAERMKAAVEQWNRGNISGLELVSRITELLISNQIECADKELERKAKESSKFWPGTTIRKDALDPYTLCGLCGTRPCSCATKRTLASDLAEDR